MSVTVRIPAVLARSAGGRITLEVAGGTVGEVVAALAALHPGLGTRLRDEKGEPYPYVVFYVDDEDIRFRQGFATPVAEGAEIVVVPAIAGG
jgi:molybdopterin synthase sulfur carrier subunit